MKPTHPLTAALVLSAAVLAGCPGQAPTTPQAPVVSLTADSQIPVGGSPHGIAALGGFVYNANTAATAESISVISTATDTVVKELKFPGAAPNYIKAFHDGKHALAIDKKRAMLLMIDPAQDHKLIQEIPLGAGPDKVVIAEDDKTAIVSLTGEAKLLHLTFGADRTQPPVRQEFAVGNVQAAERKHRSVDFAGGWGVVPNSAENNVTLINFTTGATQTVSDGNGPGPVAIGTYDTLPKVAVVGNAASHTVTLYDLPTGAKTTLDGVGLTPTEIVAEDELGRAFVTMAGSNDVAVVDYLNKRLLARLPVGKRPVHIVAAPSLPEAAGYGVLHGGHAYEYWVGNDDGESVSVIDGKAMTVLATVMTGKGHHKLTFSGTKAYVSNITANTVSVIDRLKLPRASR